MDQLATASGGQGTVSPGHLTPPHGRRTRTWPGPGWVEAKAARGTPAPPAGAPQSGLASATRGDDAMDQNYTMPQTCLLYPQYTRKHTHTPRTHTYMSHPQPPLHKQRSARNTRGGVPDDPPTTTPPSWSRLHHPLRSSPTIPSLSTPRTSRRTVPLHPLPNPFCAATLVGLARRRWRTRAPPPHRLD